MSWTKVNKPSFFLVGAAKSGTTSFYDYFKEHPNLFVPAIKEPNFFGSDIDPKDFNKAYLKTFPNNLDPYFDELPLQDLHLAFVAEEKNYQKLYTQNKNELLAGDCSSSYFFSRAAAKEIKAFNKNAKIIVTLRNPVERAFSHYLMALQLGLVTGDFKEEFNKDRALANKGWGVSELFFELGLYAQQLENYQAVFGKENVLTLLFEDWVNNMEETQEKICQFLNVPIFTALKKEGSNESRSVRNRGLHQKIMQSSFKDKVLNVLPSAVKQKAKQIYYKRDKAVLSDENRQMLLSLFKNDILKTQERINLDLSNWLKI